MRQRRCGRKSCGYGPPGRKPRLDGPLSLFPTAALLRLSWRPPCPAATSSTGTLTPVLWQLPAAFRAAPCPELPSLALQPTFSPG